jgi:prepilin-type N-terminal cleavage/methylation domain-containing protein
MTHHTHAGRPLSAGAAGKAFSLVEMVVVMVIMGILSGVAYTTSLSAFGHRDDAAAQAAARAFLADVNEHAALVPRGASPRTLSLLTGAKSRINAIMPAPGLVISGISDTATPGFDTDGRVQFTLGRSVAYLCLGNLPADEPVVTLDVVEANQCH